MVEKVIKYINLEKKCKIITTFFSEIKEDSWDDQFIIVQIVLFIIIN